MVGIDFRAGLRAGSVLYVAGKLVRRVVKFARLKVRMRVGREGKCMCVVVLWMVEEAVVSLMWN